MDTAERQLRYGHREMEVMIWTSRNGSYGMVTAKWQLRYGHRGAAVTVWLSSGGGFDVSTFREYRTEFRMANQNQGANPVKYRNFHQNKYKILKKRMIKYYQLFRFHIIIYFV